jgi:hydroxypyruvate isomerase
MQIMEGDIIRTIRQNIQHIGHFHTAGNPGRNELDESRELYYPPIMQAIAATDNDGYVGQEFSPATARVGPRRRRRRTGRATCKEVSTCGSKG